LQELTLRHPSRTVTPTGIEKVAPWHAFADVASIDAASGRWTSDEPGGTGMLRVVWSAKVTPVGEQSLWAPSGVMAPPVPTTLTNVTENEFALLTRRITSALGPPGRSVVAGVSPPVNAMTLTGWSVLVVPEPAPKPPVVQ
jgi:hypothetical protein